MYSDTHFKKSTLRSAVLFALGTIAGTGIAHAASEVCVDPDPSLTTDRANFTMLDATGFIVGGTNDVAMTWDGTVYNSSSDYTGPGSGSNITAASTTAFFGNVWTAHDIQVFLPGNYSFDVGDNTPGAGTGGAAGTNAEAAGTFMNVTVPPGLLGVHMLFDWSTHQNIDVFIVMAPDSVFGAGVGVKSPTAPCTATTKNCLWTGKGWVGGLSTNAPAGGQNWMLSSIDVGYDSNSDGDYLDAGDAAPDANMGFSMAAGGPFPGFNANFNMPGIFSNLTLRNTCATFVDTIPNAFSFTPVSNAAFNTSYESDTITVNGLGAGVNSAIRVTGGQYSVSIDGGTTWGAYSTTTPSSVQNTHMVKVRGTSPLVNGQTTSVALNIGGITGIFSIATPAVAAAQGSNFTMLDPNGGLAGGTNDVVANWDGTSDTNVNSTVFNRMTLSSVTPFFSFPWTAHHIRVFGPGTYTIDTTCTVAQLEAAADCSGNPLQPGQTQRLYTFTVGAGQIGAHMLFNWNLTTNIDVVEVWNLDQAFGPSPMYTGAAACNNTATAWDLMSTDWDGDGKNGGEMIDGAFPQFSANFNIRLPGSPILACSAYTPTVNVADPSGAGGCSISSAPANVTERADWWLVAGFLAWLGGIQMRLKRKTRS